VANVARFLAELKVLPRYVTVSDRGQGFCEVAQALLSCR
jgi:hypothetical protein